MKKAILFIFIMILSLLLLSCGGKETEPITELYFDTIVEMEDYLRSDNVKIYDPELTEQEIIDKYKIDTNNLRSDMLKYFRSYVYSDIMSLDDHLIDSCYKMEINLNDVPENNIQGLPNLLFFYEISEIDGLKGIILKFSPILSQDIPDDLSQPFVLIDDYSAHSRFDWNKSIEGFEPKPFVTRIDLRPTVENKKIVSHGYNVLYSNILFDVTYIYEKDHERTQANIDFESLVNVLLQQQTRLVTIND